MKKSLGRRLVHRRPSPAMVVACIGLAVALSGASYAAVVLPRNSVGTPQLKENAVVSSKIAAGGVGASELKANAVNSQKVKNGSLLGADFALGQLPAGPRGVKGEAGATGAPGIEGPSGAQGATGAGVEALFGDGKDGDVTMSSSAPLTRDSYYRNLTVGPGVTLDTGGYRLFVSGTLTLLDNAAIECDGSPGSVSAGGMGRAAGTLGGSGAGGDPPSGSGGSVTNSLGGLGRSRNPGGQQGGLTRPLVQAGGFQVFGSALAAISGRSLDAIQINGGSGGGSNSTGGGGGGGGGVLVISARAVIVSGTARISANGGPGASAGTPIAGAGGGGVAIVITTSSQPVGLTLTADDGGGTHNGLAEWLS